MSTHDYLFVLRPWRLLLLVIALVGGLIGYVVATTSSPLYDAEATVLVGPVSAGQDVLRAASQVTPTYGELAVSGPAIDAVAGELGLSSGAVSHSLTVTPNSETRLIAITARRNSPAEAGRIANAVSAQLVALSDDGPLAEAGQVQVVAPANEQPSPTPNYAGLYGALSAICALVAAAALLLLLERSRRVVRSEDHLRELTGFPVLATIPPTSDALPVQHAPASRAATGYRLLAAHLLSQRGGEDCETVSVTGVTQDGGSADIAANVAVALAGAGARVLLVDVGEGPGLYQRLEPAVGPDAEAVLVAPARGGVHVDAIPAAEARPGIAASSADDAAVRLRALGRDVDFVVAVPGPLTASASALNWTTASDMALLVVPGRGADSYQVAAAAQAVQLSPRRLDGIVITDQGRTLSRNGASRRRRPDAEAGAAAEDTPEDPEEASADARAQQPATRQSMRTPS